MFLTWFQHAIFIFHSVSLLMFFAFSYEKKNPENVHIFKYDQKIKEHTKTKLK